MAKSVVDLVDALINREVAGTSFQGEIREYLSGFLGTKREALEGVAIALGEYRTHREGAIKAAASNEQQTKLRKIVNNVVGDTVRNCRDWADGEYTIKCKVKKPAYIYTVKTIEPKPEAEPEPASDEPVEVPFTDDVSEDCAEQVKALVEKFSIEEVGGALAEIIKASKEDGTEAA